MIFLSRNKGLRIHWVNDNQHWYLVLTSTWLIKRKLWLVTRDLIANQSIKILIVVCYGIYVVIQLVMHLDHNHIPSAEASSNSHKCELEPAT